MADAKYDPNAPQAAVGGAPVYGAQPGYPGYANPPPPPGAPMVVVVNAVGPTRFGPAPVQLVCPYCKNTVVTSTSHENGAMVWLGVLFLCLFCFCCFFIPFMIDSFKDVVHSCPSCNNVIGRCSRL
jgi:lipopolysaccharide-induced tumor necrosis factor-alpha factor